MRIKDDPTITVAGRIEKETEKAYLFLPEDGDEAVWIAKSQVRDSFTSKTQDTLEITEWVAKKVGIM